MGSRQHQPDSQISRRHMRHRLERDEHEDEFFQAIRMDDIDTVKKMMYVFGCKIHSFGAPLSRKHPPLYEATLCEDEKMVSFLLAHGAYARESSLTYFRTSALHWAAKWNNYAAIRILVENGCEVDFLDSHGLTPLHIAILERNLDAISVLMELGACTGPVVIREISSDTALAYALLNYDRDVMTLLLEREFCTLPPGYDPLRGERVLEEALVMGDHHIARVLVGGSHHLFDYVKGTQVWVDDFQLLTKELVEFLDRKIGKQLDDQMCTRCQQFFDQSPLQHTRPFPIGPSSVTNLSISNVPCCKFCRMIMQAVPRGVSMEQDLDFHLFFRSGEGILILSRLGDAYPLKRIGLIELHSYDHLANIISHDDSTSDDITGSDASMRLANYWLHQCLTTHKTCRRYSIGGSVLPTRVVDVGPADGSQRPFLYISGGEPGLYATLSYYWNLGVAKTTNAARTTTLSLEDHKKSIREEVLPITIRNAIGVVRNLGLRYLWIDTLCIIQDSFEDWSREARNMGHIYRDSTITIAAAKEGEETTGLFCPRPSKRVNLCRVDIRLSRKDRAALSLRAPLTRLWAALPTDQSEHKESDNPTPKMQSDRRDWELQEDILSCRKLIFAQQMQWECATVTANEERPVGIPTPPEDWGHLPVYGYPSLKADLYRTIRLPPFKHYFYVAWRKIVELYTCRESRFDTDRLEGISGLARVAEGLGGGTYLLGLWKNQLWDDLSWTTATNLHTGNKSLDTRLEPSRSEHFKAPTWSWASVLSPVKWNHMGGRKECKIKIMGWKINPENSSFNVHGLLILQGLVVRLYSRVVSGTYFLHGNRNITSLAIQQWFPDIVLDHSSRKDRSLEIVCLMLSRSYDERNQTSTSNILCLQAVGGAYKRIGVCDLEDHFPNGMPKKSDDLAWDTQEVRIK